MKVKAYISHGPKLVPVVLAEMAEEGMFEPILGLFIEHIPLAHIFYGDRQ